MQDNKKASKILNNLSNKHNYKWEKEGKKILFDSNRLVLSNEDKKIIKYLLIKPYPDNSYRSLFWIKATGALKEKQKNSSNYYHQLLDYPKDLPLPFLKQIELDINRTFPNDPLFNKKEILSSLRNILLAYSIRNSSVGYCQGFNFLVGKILKVVQNEEDSFWVFVQLMEEVLPFSYYVQISGPLSDIVILNTLMKIYFPKIVLSVKSVGYEASMKNLFFKWMTTLFIQNVNTEISDLIWDLLILKGNSVLFSSALGIMHILNESILGIKSIEDMHMLFENEIYKFNNKETIFYYCLLKKFRFGHEFISNQRKNLTKIVIDTFVQSKNKTYELLKKSKRVASYYPIPLESKKTIQCDKSWPICIYDNSIKYDITYEFLVFSVRNLVFIDEYFYSNSLFSSRFSLKMKEFDFVLINRRTHFCEISSGECNEDNFVVDEGLNENELSYDNDNNDFILHETIDIIDKHNIDNENNALNMLIINKDDDEL